MKAVILAAGKGTRLKEFSKNQPKPLVAVHNKQSLLEIVLRGIRNAGIQEIIVVTGCHANQIEDAFEDGSQIGVSLAYVRQEELNGTGGALRLTQSAVGGCAFLMTFGDIFVQPSHYRHLVEAYQSQPSPVIISVNKVDDPFAGAAVYFDDRTFLIQRIIEKPPKGTSSTQWNSAGVMVFEPLVFDYLKKLTPSPRGELELPDAIRQMAVAGHPARALPIQGFWRDMGTPEDVEFIRRMLANDPSCLDS